MSKTRSTKTRSAGTTDDVSFVFVFYQINILSSCGFISYIFQYRLVVEKGVVMVDCFTPWNRNEAPTRRFEPTDTDFFEKMELLIGRQTWYVSIVFLHDI